MRIAAAILMLGFSASVVMAVDVDAITRPSDDVTLSFVQAGKVAKVLVKDGQVVEAGQVLIQQDDAAEQELVAQLRDEAENPVRIQAADAQLQQKKVDFDKTQLAAEKEAATSMELEHARLDVTIGELSLALSKLEASQAKHKYEEARIRVDRMAMRTPIGGKVERIIVKEGEGADALAKVVRVVKVDPLWIDVPVPLASANQMSLGDSLNVTFPDHGNASSGVGRIIFKAAVADAASDTLLVRLEVPNPTMRPAGERLKINVSDVIAAAPEPATQPAVAEAVAAATPAEMAAPAEEATTQPTAAATPADEAATQPTSAASIE